MSCRRFLLVAILGVFALLTSCSHDANRGKLTVTVIDVGQADCILVETPSGHAMLIDGGGSNDETQVDTRHVGLQTVVPYLRYRGIDRLDVVLLTHPHSDHCGGLPDILRSMPVGQVLDGTVLPYPTPPYEHFLQTVQQFKIPYRVARRGMRLDFQDGVTALIVNPPAGGAAYGTTPDNTTMNNYSAVVRLTYGSTHILLDGDAQTEAEQNMLAAYTPSELTADVLKCGHHGAANATSDEWLTAVHPTYATISCGLHNHFGHPSPLTVARLQAHDIRTFVTAQSGAIVFVDDGQTITATPTHGK